MELFPWKPIRLSLLDADRQIDDAFNQFIVSMCGGESSQAIWSPQIDVYEADDAYVIEADLPGVSQDQLHVQVADTVVTISGTRATTQHGQSAVASGSNASTAASAAASNSNTRLTPIRSRLHRVRGRTASGCPNGRRTGPAHTRRLAKHPPEGTVFGAAGPHW